MFIFVNFCYLFFFFVILYIGFCYGILVYFVYWFIDDFGGFSVIMVIVGVVREMLVLIFFGFSIYVLKVLGNVSMMLFCLFFYIICFICYFIFVNFWMVVVLEVLDGGIYGFVWLICVSYMSKVGFEFGVIESI